MPRKAQSVWSVQRLSRLLAFLTRSQGSQPPPFRGCCWDAQSPSPRARGGVVVCRAPTDRGRRRGAPGSTDGRFPTRRRWTVGVCPADMFQHRRQCNCWSFFCRGLRYNLVVFTTSSSKVFFGTTQLDQVFTSFLRHQYLDLGLWSYDSTTLDATTTCTKISDLFWKLLATFWTSAVHTEIPNFAAHKAPRRGAGPAARCLLFCNDQISLIHLVCTTSTYQVLLRTTQLSKVFLPVRPHQYLDLGIWSCDCINFEPTTNQSNFYHLRWKLFAPFCTSAVHKDIRNLALHTASLRGDRPATRCLPFWGVCKCVPPFHATQEVHLCTRTSKLYLVYSAWKKTTACFSMDGKGTRGMVLTPCSVAVCVCLEKIGGYNIYGQ